MPIRPPRRALGVPASAARGPGLAGALSLLALTFLVSFAAVPSLPVRAAEEGAPPATSEAPPPSPSPGDGASSPSPGDAGSNPSPGGPARLASRTAHEVRDWPILEVPWQRLRYNGRRVLPARTGGLVDEQGVPLRTYRRDDGPVYNPTVLAEEGMMRLDSWLRTEDRVHLRQARRIAAALDATALEERGRRWQPHPYSRFGYASGWVNANSHGLVLSFFSRLHELTGDEAARATADRLFAAYDPLAGQRRSFSAIVDGYLWFEHYPESFRGQVLNAHLNAVFGLYDYWRISGSDEAARMLKAGVTTVRDQLERFRRPGDLSAYSLTTDFVSEHYHDTHIKQLRLLARMTGDAWFATQVERFEEDERAWRAEQAAAGGERVGSEAGEGGERADPQAAAGETG